MEENPCNLIFQRFCNKHLPVVVAFRMLLLIIFVVVSTSHYLLAISLSLVFCIINIHRE